jgi:hypothetical protein
MLGINVGRLLVFNVGCNDGLARVRKLVGMTVGDAGRDSVEADGRGVDRKNNVGDVDGVPVDIIVGIIVSIESREVGRNDKVKAAVDATVGAYEGKAVGIASDTVIGTAVGVTESISDGTAVAAFMGTAVGDTVDAVICIAVGAPVGAS